MLSRFVLQTKYVHCWSFTYFILHVLLTVVSEVSISGVQNQVVKIYLLRNIFSMMTFVLSTADLDHIMMIFGAARYLSRESMNFHMSIFWFRNCIVNAYTICSIICQATLIYLSVFQGRPFTYTNTDTTGLNVMLNSNDVSEYLKISADGLEVWWTHYPANTSSYRV